METIGENKKIILNRLVHGHFNERLMNDLITFVSNKILFCFRVF